MRSAVTFGVILVAATASQALGDDAAPPAPRPAAGSDAPSEPAPESPYDDATTAASPIEPHEDAGWQLYHDAFSALARGDRNGARSIIHTLETEHPGHPAIELAHRVFEVELARPATEAVQPLDGRERRSQNATSEFALFQTVNGLTLGIELCLALDCNSGASGFALALAGSAVGAYATLHGDNVTPGRRAVYNSTVFWGAMNASFFVTQAHPDNQGGGLGMMLGQLGGVLAGTMIAPSKPTAGQVALTNTGGEWGMTLSALTIATLNRGLVLRDESIYIAAATDVGLGVGAYLASRLPHVSRGQTLVIDSGGILGGVVGGAVGIMITGDVSDRPVSGLAGIGVIAGLFTAAYLTRDWHADEVTELHAGLVPVEGGGMLSAHLAW